MGRATVQRSRISAPEIFLKRLFGSVVDRVRSEWSPGRLADERAYQRSLEAFLRAVLPGRAALSPEYPHLGGRLDFFIRFEGLVQRHEVIVELKHDLKDKAEFDRLVGQLEGLEPDRQEILLVLCGETRPDFLATLERRYEALMNPLPGQEPSFAIVCKP